MLWKHTATSSVSHDVIKWKHFPRYCPFVWGMHRSPVHSPHKGQWRGALMFSLICSWTNVWVSNRDAGDLRFHRAHYKITSNGSIHTYICVLRSDAIATSLLRQYVATSFWRSNDVIIASRACWIVYSHKNISKHEKVCGVYSRGL